MSINNKEIWQSTESFWEEQIIDSLSDYIRIPNKSPMFDPDWKANGYMDDAIAHVTEWVESQQVPNLKLSLHELESRTPTLLLEYPGEIDETVLIYGHIDKQPEFSGWYEDLEPWLPVRKTDKLYGRGGADDGYAIYSAISALKSLIAQNAELPRVVILIEASEESGSPDLPVYMEQLSEDIGTPSLVIALDSTCGNYDQLWITTSLRGMLIGELKVQVLEQGAHSGAAGGIVGSSFRLLRQLISRVEDENTGEILPSFLNEQIPDSRRREAEKAGEVLGDDLKTMYTYAGDSGPISEDATELILNNTWLASMEVTGIDGIPDLANAGNVLRPHTTAKIALRLPPTTDAMQAKTELTELLTENLPTKRKSLSILKPQTLAGMRQKQPLYLRTLCNRLQKPILVHRQSLWVAAGAFHSWNFLPRSYLKHSLSLQAFWDLIQMPMGLMSSCIFQQQKK